MTFHVYCTASNSTKFVKYNSVKGGHHVINTVVDEFTIAGGSGIADLKNKLHTPMGVHTAVPDDKMEWLKDDFTFKAMQKAGYITVRQRNVNPEVAAADMVTHDRRTDSCPITPNDFSDKPVADGLTKLEPKLNKVA